tara:strand:+ start:114 stop:1553 length:1440 start_codon:yes stop_codon:yes gene_type:complete
VETKNLFKHFLRFAFLQALITGVTIYYFDKFLIGSYTEGYNIILRNLLEDRDRFYPFVTNYYIKIDLFLGIFVFIFLILLYSSKFYSIANELTFSTDKSFLDEYVPIYLIWSASLLSFLQITRFTAVSRGYLLLFTFIIPLILVMFRNTEFLSNILGRNIKNENYISFNLDNESLFRQIKLLKHRNEIQNYTIEGKKFFDDVLVEIEKINKKTKINLVVIRLKDVQKLPADFERKLLELNKKVLFLSNIHLTFNHKFIYRSSELNNRSLIYINNDIQYGSKYIIKRVLDIIFSILGSIITLPITIFATLLILVKDGRPIILKQTRVGLHGNNFKIYKFRTMKKDSHSERTQLDKNNKKTGPLFKLDNDPRLIEGANSLRKYSVDEIPQFINVIKGEMSLVGPRPLFPEDNKYYDSSYIRRLNVLPGITGLLQINERNTDDFDIWYKYDMEYIENWSIGLDLKIIIKTPFSLFSNKTKGI